MVRIERTPLKSVVGANSALICEALCGGETSTFLYDRFQTLLRSTPLIATRTLLARMYCGATAAMPLRNTTFNLPDDLVQHAKAYAAREGTTVTAIVRDNLERVTGYRAGQSRGGDALVAFSEGRMSKEAAIRSLGLRDYAQLMVSLGELDLPLPRLPAHEIEAMTNTFVAILQQAKREKQS